MAGTSVEELLTGFEGNQNDSLMGWNEEYNFWLQHATCQQLLSYNLVGKIEYESYFKFAFVRNPWERALSEYKWRVKVDSSFSKFLFPLKNDSNRLINKIRNYLSFPKVSFKDFLLLKKDDQLFSRKSVRYRNEWLQHNTLQCNYILDDEGKLMVDFIGRFEKLDRDWKTICKAIGINSKLPNINVSSSKKHYTTYYNEETKAIIEKKYKKDIEYLGYEFGRPLVL